MKTHSFRFQLTTHPSGQLLGNISVVLTIDRRADIQRAICSATIKMLTRKP